MNLCVIPAKKISQRIIGKNTRSFLGKPIIQYSIEIAKASGLFERIVVSSDSDDIGGLATKFEAIYHKRPLELTLPNTPMADVVIDALAGQSLNGEYENICMLYPCAPLVTVRQLVHGLDKLKDGYDLVFPIYHGPHPEQSMIIQNRRLMMRYPEYEGENSQIWIDTYFHAGMWFWAEVKSLEHRQSFVSEKMYGVILPEYEVQDIDTEEDWKMAEIKYRYIHNLCE